MRVVSIAALQTAPVPRQPETTLDRLAARAPVLREIVPSLGLVVLPELHLSAPPPLLEEAAGYAEEVAVEIPGPLTDRLGEIARACDAWMVAGSVYERGDTGLIHNTVPVLSPTGELVATYRKLFPWQPHEATAPGGRFVTFDIPGAARIGLAVCYDGNFPETARQLAWLGAEVIVQPALTTTSDRDAELVLARANAIANQLFVVNLNAAAPAGLGRSVIVDPEGLIRVRAGDSEELLTDALDLDTVTRVRELGTANVSRMWEQIMRTGPELELPMYGGRVRRPG